MASTGKQLDTRNPAYFEEVRAAIESAGISDKFRLLGMVPYEHIAPLACANIALLNPSHFEGWSTIVEEPRLLGVPMLLSDLAVHREQADDSAFYFDQHSVISLADALQSLKPCPPADRKRLSREALADTVHRIKRFADDFSVVVNHAAISYS